MESPDIEWSISVNWEYKYANFAISWWWKVHLCYLRCHLVDEESLVLYIMCSRHKSRNSHQMGTFCHVVMMNGPLVLSQMSFRRERCEESLVLYIMCNRHMSRNSHQMRTFCHVVMMNGSLVLSKMSFRWEGREDLSSPVSDVYTSHARNQSSTYFRGESNLKIHNTKCQYIELI